MPGLFKKVERFVIDSFTKAGKAPQIKHFERTVYWVKQLRAGADETLLISAMAHDIERAFRQRDVLEKKQTLGFTDKEFLRPHEERGAEIIAEFLKEQGADEELIGRVKMLVSRHEEGGDDDQNLLKDADSVSFFENNVPLFLTKKAEEVGRERVKQKFDWMYNRITSGKAKQIAKDWYENAVRGLELADSSKSQYSPN